MAELIYDNFRINIKNQLNAEDYRSLTLLYLPLMGIDSYVTYSVFMSLDNNEIYTFKKVLDLLNFVSLNALNKAIDKLEGLGLINSYYSETKGYLYELIQPLSISLYFNNEMLTSLLEAQIGETEIEKIISKSKTKIVGYKNVTKKFNEVYQTSTKSISKTLNNLIINDVIVENKDFNYTLFKILIDNVISEDVLNDEKFKQRIERISYTYKLNEEEMKDVLIKTLDIDHDFEYASISKNARLVFQKKYKTDLPHIETIQDDNYISSIKDDDWLPIINYVESMQVADVLENISGIKPAVSEIKMFEDLANNTHFPIAVINLMILYVNRDKEGELPGYNYFEKIANVWARAKIKTPYDVLKYFEKKKDKNPEKTSSNKKAVKPVPNWYEEYTKQLNNQQKQDLPEDKKEEMKKLVKDIFG